jgi:hypothetical protein
MTNPVTYRCLGCKEIEKIYKKKLKRQKSFYEDELERLQKRYNKLSDRYYREELG